MKQFAGERNVTERFLTMNDKAHRIIGVLPPFVQFPGQNDLYMPTTACPFRSSERVIGSREARMVSLIGRLTSGATLAGAGTETASVASRMHQAYPQSYPAEAGFATSVASVHEEDLTHGAADVPRPVRCHLAGAGSGLRERGQSARDAASFSDARSSRCGSPWARAAAGSCRCWWWKACCSR